MAYKSMNKIVCGKYNAALAVYARPFSAGNTLKPNPMEMPAFQHLMSSSTAEKHIPYLHLQEYSTRSSMKKAKNENVRYRFTDGKKVTDIAKLRDSNVNRDTQDILKSKIPVLHRAIDDLLLSYKNENTSQASKKNSRLQYQSAITKIPNVKVSAKGTRHQFVLPEKNSSVLEMIKNDLLETINRVKRRPHTSIEFWEDDVFTHSPRKPKLPVKGCTNESTGVTLSKGDKSRNTLRGEVKRKIPLGNYANKLKQFPSMFRLKRDVIRPDINEMQIRHQIKFTRPLVTRKLNY